MKANMGCITVYFSWKEGSDLRKEDIRLYHQIQKNTQRIMSSIDTLTEKIYDKDLSVEASREFMMFADIQNRALKELTNNKVEGYRPSQVQDTLHRSGLQVSSILDNSTCHMADMLIQQNSKGVTELCHCMKQNENASKQCMELAEELEGFEEKNMERLKKYL